MMKPKFDGYAAQYDAWFMENDNLFQSELRLFQTALGDIADEDSLNEITHYLEHEDPAIRTKACCVAAKLNTDYLNTRVRYQMSQEKDPEVKKAIQEALDHAGHIVEP